MKVTFNVDSKANIHSCKSITFDLDTERGQKALGFTKEGWISLNEYEKQEVVQDWADNYIEVYYDEEES